MLTDVIDPFLLSYSWYGARAGHTRNVRRACPLNAFVRPKTDSNSAETDRRFARTVIGFSLRDGTFDYSNFSGAVLFVRSTHDAYVDIPLVDFHKPFGEYNNDENET